jgi:tripartite-type tricarboxylate transporter receptor subunit TctC
MNNTPLLGLLAVAGATLSINAAWAQQDYPNKPIRLVTMFAPGSNSDQTARFAGAKVSEQMGVSFIIENKAGGGGLAALRDVYRAQPMGYSVLQSNTAFVGNTLAFKEPLYRIEDYTSVGVLGEGYYGLIFHNSVPVKTLAEFVAYAKANPGKLNYGSLGPAAGSTLNAERFKQAAGIDMVGIPFKGGEPVSIALLAGQIQVYWATLGTARNRMQNPQISGLAVTAPKRVKILPDLPTFKEAGFPTMDASSWQAWFAPAAIPKHMLDKLREGFVKASKTPEWQTRMERNELDEFDGTPDQFMARLKKEQAQLAADYKRLNLPQE